MTKRICIVLVGICCIAISVQARCPFCSVSGATLSQEAAAAAIIVYGTPRDATLDPNDFAQGSTRFDIENVIKSHPIIENQKSITIKKYLPQPDQQKSIKLLAFADVFQGKLDVYRALPFGPSAVQYMTGVLSLKDKPTAERLVFFLKYMNDPDPSIATDAFMEFGYADYKDMRPIAEKASRKSLIEWLQDPGLALSRLGLYASILGHCGNADDVKVLKNILEDPKRRYSGGIDGVLAGIILLDHEGGWRYLTEAMSNPNKDFMIRHAALRTARFFWEYRSDVIDRQKVAATTAKMLEQPDICDMVIEDLRKWSYWKPANKILGLLKNKDFDTLLIRRAIVRYMLSCPAEECREAAAFVAAERERDKQYISDIESLLRQEQSYNAGVPKVNTGKP